MRRCTGASILALAGIVVAMASACASTGKDKAKELQRSVEGYNRAYRWKNYERAAAFLPADLRAAFVANYEEDDKALHIEGYQVLQVTWTNPELAEVKVRYRYLQLPSVTLEKRTVVQHWALVNDQWTLEHEDDSIRPMTDPAPSKPREDVFGGPPADPSMELEITTPSGEVIRRPKASDANEER